MEIDRLVIALAVLTGYLVGGFFVFLWLMLAALELMVWPNGVTLGVGFATITAATTVGILLKA